MDGTAGFGFHPLVLLVVPLRNAVFEHAGNAVKRRLGFGFHLNPNAPAALAHVQVGDDETPRWPLHARWVLIAAGIVVAWNDVPAIAPQIFGRYLLAGSAALEGRALDKFIWRGCAHGAASLVAGQLCQTV